MEYFTRTWATGNCSDEEFDGTTERYQSYVDSLDHEGPVWRFATSISLNDAYVDWLDCSEGVLSLRLLTGDLQRGYWHTLICYGEGRIILGQKALERALKARPTEIWYDEFAATSAGMVHRFLLVEEGTLKDRGEFHIGFCDFSFSQTRAVQRILRG
jgi:hypothetical protein